MTTEAGAHYRDFDLEQFLPYWLSRLSNTVSQGIARYYQQAYGLTVPEWRVMAVLGRYPGLTASEICERTVMDKVTVSRAVKTLLEREYLERVTDSSDRRRRPLRVSEPAGTTMMAAVIPHALDYQATLLSGLTESERRAFRELSERLLTAAAEINRRPFPQPSEALPPGRAVHSGR